MKGVRTAAPVRAHGIRVPMPTDFTTQFIVVATGGIAVGLAGAVNLLASRLGRIRRTVLTAFSATVPLAGLAQLDPGTPTVLAVAGIVFGLLFVTGWWGTTTARTLIGRRAAGWVGLVALGVLTVTASAVRYDR